MGLGSAGYGFLLGSLGVGAIIGIFVLPIARRRLSDNVILVLSALLYAVGVVAAAFLPFALTLVLLALSGIAWIGTLTVLNAALQLTLPQWVRSRGAAAYILVFMGTMAAGSVRLGCCRTVGRHRDGAGRDRAAARAGGGEHPVSPPAARHGHRRTAPSACRGRCRRWCSSPTRPMAP